MLIDVAVRWTLSDSSYSNWGLWAGGLVEVGCGKGTVMTPC